MRPKSNGSPVRQSSEPRNLRLAISRSPTAGGRRKLADSVEIERLDPARRSLTARSAIGRQLERAAAGIENQSHGSSTRFAFDLFPRPGPQIELARGFD